MILAPSRLACSTCRYRKGFFVEKLLKINEVSDLLQVSPKTIYNWVCYGYIPYFKVYNMRGREGLLRFRESDIEKWLQKRKQNGRASYKDMVLSQQN